MQMIQVGAEKHIIQILKSRYKRFDCVECDKCGSVVMSIKGMIDAILDLQEKLDLDDEEGAEIAEELDSLLDEVVDYGLPPDVDAEAWFVSHENLKLVRLSMIHGKWVWGKSEDIILKIDNRCDCFKNKENGTDPV